MVGLHSRPPWWSFEGLAADDPRESNPNADGLAVRRLKPSSASGRIGALGLLVTLRLKPCVGLRARAAGQWRRVRAKFANDCIVLAGARFVAEGPALRAQHRGRPKGGEARQRPARSLAELPALEAGVVHKVGEGLLCQVRSTRGAKLAPLLVAGRTGSLNLEAANDIHDGQKAFFIVPACASVRSQHNPPLSESMSPEQLSTHHVTSRRNPS